jgi:hypothetical protein
VTAVLLDLFRLAFDGAAARSGRRVQVSGRASTKCVRRLWAAADHSVGVRQNCWGKDGHEGLVSFMACGTFV